MSCIIVTKEIREMANEIGESPHSLANLIGIWQELNKKTLDEYPSIEEIKSLIGELRSETAPKITNTQQTTSNIIEGQNIEAENKSTVKKQSREASRMPVISTVKTQEKVNLLFSPKKRRARVNLIARNFSYEVTKLLEEKKKELQTKISISEGAEKLRLIQELDTLSRKDIINEYTPAGIFSRVRDIFLMYINDSNEGRIQAELDIINKKEGSEEFDEESKYNYAKEAAEYALEEYTKIAEDEEVFKALAEETGHILEQLEDLRLDINYMEASENTKNEEKNENEDPETPTKDGWMTKAKFISSYSSLSKEIKKIITSIERLDKDGYVEEDDLGNPIYLDADFVHAVLISASSNMIDSRDLMPMLESLKSKYNWVENIIDEVNSNEILKAKLYVDLRKDYSNYWIQTHKKKNNGGIRIKTKSLVSPESIYFILDMWRSDYESGTVLTKNSIYDKKGELSKENALTRLNELGNIRNKFNNKSYREKIEYVESDPEIIKDISDILKSVGISVDQESLLTSLTTATKIKGGRDPFNTIFQQLDIILSKVSKTPFLQNSRNETEDLITYFEGAYDKIARALNTIIEGAYEANVFQNGKSTYAHTNPNYLGKLIKNLKAVHGDSERFNKFIEKEYKQYSWFNKNGIWLNDWLGKLESSEEYRKGLEHKIVLSFGRNTYEELDSLSYQAALITEFFGFKADSKSKINWAWYYVPILSDAPSAEFIKFVRYIDGSEVDVDGNPIKYQDIILDKLTNVVQQEYNRIMLCRKRAANKNTATITNFDRYKDTPGRGEQFCFFPSLNDPKLNFIDNLIALNKAHDTSGIKKYIRDTLSTIIEEEFEDAMIKWDKMGLFEETKSGELSNIDIEGVKGRRADNKVISQALLNAKSILKEAWTSEMQEALDVFSKDSQYNSKKINEIISKIKESVEYAVHEGSTDVRHLNNINRALNLINNNKIKEAMRNYYWNNKLATSQIIQLTTTDLAYYKNAEDFQKRFKEIHAPSTRLYTEATFEGERIGRDIERTIYIKDSITKSELISEIKSVLNDKIKKGELSTIDRDYIITQYEKINVADAQAFRSLSSYRAIMGMLGKWTKEQQRAYDNFKNGIWDIRDFNTIWQTQKPFLYSQVAVSSGIEGETNIKVPVQHKNSEFLLMAAQLMVSGPLKNSGKLRAINDFMESDKDNPIDVVQFESAVKVGNQSPIDLQGLEDYNSVMKELKEKCFLNGAINPNVVHEVSYEDYGIQTETPEHIIDKTQLIGTQIRKIIMSDISQNAILATDELMSLITELPPNTILPYLNISREKILEQGGLNKFQWYKMYQGLITHNIFQSFRNVSDIFSDTKKVEERLLKELRDNPRYDNDLKRACTLNEEGMFNIPLFDLVQSQRVQQLANSIIKNEVTKQKIKGGACIQVSSYGLTEELNVVFKAKDGTLISYETFKIQCAKHNVIPNKKKYQEWKDSYAKKGGLSIAYFECYLPAYSKAFYEKFMYNDSHELNINLLPEHLRKAIGYRIPTEDKYSIVPIYIKGFLPQQNGSAIMLPQEITTISGSDFDIDKLYIMLPEFKLVDVLDEKGKKTGVRDLQKVEYDFSKSMGENSLEARNNLMLDLMWAVLTNEDTASKVLNPGGFDPQKKSDRICRILTNTTKENLKKKLLEGGIQLNKTIEINGKKVAAPLVSYLQDIPLSIDKETKIRLINEGKPHLDLNDLIKNLTPTIDPLSPLTQIYFHNQNMTGGKMIGIYANHNANHALMQYTDLSIKPQWQFRLNHKTLSALNRIQNDNGEIISKNNAGFLAASVDNVKDPVLAGLNQNMFTADATMILSRLGYDSLEIGVLLNQPIIKDMTNAYFKEINEGTDKSIIIKKVIKEWKNRSTDKIKLFKYEDVKDFDFDLYNLMDNLISETPNIYRQVAVGYLFERIMKDADALGQLTQATRVDTQGGAAGPTNADTLIKKQKLQDLLAVKDQNDFPLSGCDIITDGLKYDKSNPEGFLNKLLASKMPFLQGFFSCGIEEVESLLGKYFPHFKNTWTDVVDEIRDYTKNKKLDADTVNNIYDELLAYIISDLPFFKSVPIWAEADNEGNPIKIKSVRDVRNAYIKDFPAVFEKIVSENPDIAELEFIKHLKVIKANDYNKLKVNTIMFKNSGRISTIQRKKIINDWASLMYSQNFTARNLAFELVKYSFFRNGLGFGPNNFSQFIPTVVRQSIPGYIEKLNGILTSNEDFIEFIDQWVLNHLDTKRVVPEISSEYKSIFYDSQNNPRDEFTFSPRANEYQDLRFVKEEGIIGGEHYYDFYNYISFNNENNYTYYKLLSTNNNVATYSRVQPLGIKNEFIEYEYGNSAEAIESVFSDSTEEVEVISSPETGIENSNIDASSEDNSSYENSSIKNKDGEYDKEMTEYLKNKFGITETTEQKIDILNQEGNEDYTDASGLPLC